MSGQSEKNVFFRNPKETETERTERLRLTGRRYRIQAALPHVMDGETLIARVDILSPTNTSRAIAKGEHCTIVGFETDTDKNPGVYISSSRQTDESIRLPLRSVKSYFKIVKLE